MKLHEHILIMCMFAPTIIVGLYVYDFISTATLVVLGVLTVAFGISSALKVFNIK